MNILPDKAAFLELATRYSVIPVSIEVLGDRETPVSVFEKLVGDRSGFLLESMEGGETWARWSFVGWDPAYTLVARDGESVVEAGSSDVVPEVPAGDPLAVVEQLLGGERAAAIDGLPPLHSGAVGYVGYDVARYNESLPDSPPDDRGFPELLLQFVGSLAAFDRFRDTIRLVRNVFVGDDPGAQFESAVSALEASRRRLELPGTGSATVRPEFTRIPDSRPNLSADEFREIVRRSIEYIESGDVFQVVPSLRLALDLGVEPFRVYRALRLLNPSPYLFHVQHAGVALVGASPELLVRSRDGIVYSRPIAGTRRRGATADEDLRREEELLADPKERAEHVMLVDLARNDIGRVAEYGTIRVDELMAVEHYSHVMHIVSAVSGKLRPGVGPVDVLRATFPHGTVTGAPKVRAMEIIDELEPQARGPYAGAVGYMDFGGDLDMAIALRSLVVAGDRAWVQAGAGVVADSDPTAEYEECLAKAQAVLAAIGGAHEI